MEKKGAKRATPPLSLYIYIYLSRSLCGSRRGELRGVSLRSFITRGGRARCLCFAVPRRFAWAEVTWWRSGEEASLMKRSATSDASGISPAKELTRGN